MTASEYLASDPVLWEREREREREIIYLEYGAVMSQSRAHLRAEQRWPHSERDTLQVRLIATDVTKGSDCHQPASMPNDL